MVTKLGRLDLNVPQVRGGVDFYPSALEKGVRSERALKLAMAEMYIQGVSTRKVTSVLEKLCGLDISSTQVSNASKLLDNGHEAELDCAAEVHWRDFLLSLKKRGLHGVKMITSDDHTGLKSALISVFPSVPWQRPGSFTKECNSLCPESRNAQRSCK